MGTRTTRVLAQVKGKEVGVQISDGSTHLRAHYLRADGTSDPGCGGPSLRSKDSCRVLGGGPVQPKNSFTPTSSERDPSLRDGGLRLRFPVYGHKEGPSGPEVLPQKRERGP